MFDLVITVLPLRKDTASITNSSQTPKAEQYIGYSQYYTRPTEYYCLINTQQAEYSKYYFREKLRV